MVIAIDFDGTCVTHAFPNVGKEIGAVDVIKALVNKGHKIILFTMRDLEYLTPAVAWFEKNDIPLYGINDNPGAKWSTSRKVYADMYIDDMALGIPLKMDYNKSNRPFVDWAGVESLLKKKGIL
jgi:hydroxymethylpyrimidine pyrophosphatase-like HAD family hydrolase